MSSQSPPPSAPKDTNGSKQPKLRSTCDACQDAKVRCSHDNPRCRRCQAHKIKCVYSLSRRMGRPRRLQTNGNEPKQQKNKSSNVLNGSSGSMELEVTPPLIAISEAEPAQPTSFQDALATLSWDKSASITAIDPFDTNFSSPECVDFSSSSDGSRVRSDSSFSFPSLSLWDHTALSEERVINAFSPQALLYTNSHAIFPGDLSVNHSTNTTSSQGIMDITLDFQSPRNEPQRQQQEPFKMSELMDETDANKSTSPPEAKNRTCDCYASVLGELSNLDQTKVDNQDSSIDIVLRVEKGVQKHAANILSCELCAGNRSGLLLLLVMVIDHVVRVLGNISSGAKTIPPQRKSSSDRNGNNSKDDNSNDIPLSPRMAMKTSSESRRGESPGGLTTAWNCKLLVGEQEIVGPDKVEFMKLLVQGRLSRLCSTLRRLKRDMQDNPQDSNSKAGNIMVIEIHRRLQSVIGRLELWDG
uniref:ZopL7 n=2 Tax=Diffractella curvata TaxID=2819868 RepID=A0A8A5D8M4_9PEZI|nr:ZopL7 [Diffractella curvata]